MDVQPGVYEHYKGGKYRVYFVAKDEASGEDVVVYETLYDNDVSRYWVRRVSVFLEDVDVDGKTVPRFRFCGETI